MNNAKVVLGLERKCDVCGKRGLNGEPSCDCTESDKELLFDQAQFETRYQQKRQSLGNGCYKVLKGTKAS